MLKELEAELLLMFISAKIDKRAGWQNMGGPRWFREEQAMCAGFVRGLEWADVITEAQLYEALAWIGSLELKDV